MTMIMEAREVTKDFVGRRSLAELIAGKRPPVLHAVKSVSLDIAAGELIGVIGESGCGKSTFARCLAGLHSPDAGAITFQGKPLEGPDPHGRIQMVFQDPYSSLNPRMTVGMTLGEVLRKFRPELRRGDLRRTVDEMLEKVGLPREAADRYPNVLSGGQRQRVSIARALCPNPAVLIADEPVSALDASVQAQIINLFQKLNQEEGITIAFISHDMMVIRHLCTRVAVMYLGEIVEVQTIEGLFSHPRHPYTRALIEAAPDINRRDRRKREPLTGELPDPFDEIPGCSFASRCRYVAPSCIASKQTLREFTGGALVRCRRAEEIIKTSER
jgi:peptide/nickel transport system ATP-binding protein